MSQLEYLDVSYNKIISIPNEIGDCSQLRHIILNNNWIKELPLTTGKLINLSSLSIENNKLKYSLLSISSFHFPFLSLLPLFPISSFHSPFLSLLSLFPPSILPSLLSSLYFLLPSSLPFSPLSISSFHSPFPSLLSPPFSFISSLFLFPLLFSPKQTQFVIYLPFICIYGELFLPLFLPLPFLSLTRVVHRYTFFPSLLTLPSLLPFSSLPFSPSSFPSLVEK